MRNLVESEGLRCGCNGGKCEPDGYKCFHILLPVASRATEATGRRNRVVSPVPSSQVGSRRLRLGARIFEDQLPVSLVLEDEDRLFSVFSVRILDLLNQERSLFAIKSNVPINCLRKPYRNALTAGLLREGVHNFLRKSMEENGSSTVTVCDDCA